MGQTEGTQLVSSRTVGHILSQDVESRGAEKKIMSEQELSVTSSIKKRCFACHNNSHCLKQCGTKYKHTTVAHQFGYATKYPFTMIQPSEEVIQKEKFYHHCVMITSNLSNLDLGVLKSELLKFWKLSGDWELRRQCGKSFLVSVSSEDDVISCLKHPKMETLLGDKEVHLTITRWNESDDGSLDLVEDWLLVSGVPRIYRNWMELYQVASAFGVLIDVDEESLEVGDKEPIRLKIASRSFDGAPFSYYFAFGWSSKLVMLTAVQDKTEGMKYKNKEFVNEHQKELNATKSILWKEAKGIEESRSNGEAKENKNSALAGQSSFHLSQKIGAPASTTTNSEKTTTESSKPEGVQSICPSPRIMIGKQQLRGMQKPPIKHVFKRRNKKQQVTEAISKSPSNKMDKEVAPHSNSNATRTEAPTGCDMLEKHCSKVVPQRELTRTEAPTGCDMLEKDCSKIVPQREFTRTEAPTGCDMLEKDCSKIVPQRELNMEEITPVGESKKAKKLGACRDTENNNVAAPTINLKKTQILGDTTRTPRNELITKHTKCVEMDKMGSGVQVQKKEDASKRDRRLLSSSEEVGIYESFSEMGLQENLLKGIYHYGLRKPSAVHKRGIVPLCKGFGVVHRSFSGTTETICTGVLQRLRFGSAECQALILVPTPDLAQETKKVIGALGQFLGVTAQTCTGGTSAHAHQQTQPSRVQVVIGTPDCILDMMLRHALSPDHIRMLFLDEADELLTGGFKDQIHYIILHLPKKIQVGLFSATYSNEAIQASRRFIDKPVEVTVPREEELKNVKQYYLAVENEELKLGKLYPLIKATGVGVGRRLIIFVNTKDKARSLAKDISKHYAVSISHDAMNQHARNRAMQNLESGSFNILVSTDHRGTNISMPQVPTIINYDVPTESMQYVRRLQQQNRQFGKPQSVAINLVTRADLDTLAPITKFCNTSIGKLPSDIFLAARKLD